MNLTIFGDLTEKECERLGRIDKPDGEFLICHYPIISWYGYYHKLGLIKYEDKERKYEKIIR